MQIIEERKDHSIILCISGRLDVAASQTLEEEISKWIALPMVWNLILDLSKIEYISSAGIRVLLSAKKKMKSNRDLIILNPSLFCKQVFEVTGADIFLTIVYK